MDERRQERVDQLATKPETSTESEVTKSLEETHQHEGDTTANPSQHGLVDNDTAPAELTLNEQRNVRQTRQSRTTQPV